jgi:DNA polymerase I-like protein with 3'-5' exonuclease and polymerase domains
MNRESHIYDYMDEIQALWPVSFSMQTGGMHIDVPALIQVRKDVAIGVTLREANLKSLIGWIPNTKSYIDMGKLLEQFGVPVQRTPSGRPKISKEVLLLYGSRFPDIRPALSECLEITKRRTLASNFLGMALDQSDYYHPTYRLNGTKQGRFASEGADEGGPQGQNWPTHLRNIVIPDSLNDELTSADMKQAEAMLVAWDSQDIFWIRCFEAKKDAHRVMGLILFQDWDIRTGLPNDNLIATIKEVCDVCANEGLSECTHSQRFIGKSSGFAFKYGMGARKYVTKQLPPAGLFMSESEGKRIRSKVITPALAKWQQFGGQKLESNRWQENILGRRREFYGQIDNEMTREYLAWSVSSVISIIVSRAMMKFDKLSDKIKGTSNLPKPRIMTCTHDSLLINHRKSMRRDVHEALTESFYHPLSYHGRALNIPLGIKAGENWRDAK